MSPPMPPPTTPPGVSTPAPPTPPELDPQAHVGHAFKAAMTAVRRLRGRETQGLGRLSYAQYSLLFGLAEQNELPASQLAALADLAPGTVTQMLDHLEADGLVARTRSARDKRLVLVSLTDQGGELVRTRRTKFEGLWQEALAGFSDDELHTAAAVLERLSELFDGFDGDD
jgi:MarR family transcriptional regulator, organic hydroperoxide resistance regulator